MSRAKPRDNTRDGVRENPERVYQEWDRALTNNDAEALLALYAPDAVIESPVIPHLLGIKRGICQGHAEIRALIDEVVRRKPDARKFFRTPYLTDGKTLMWEYPRETPADDQMDFVEVMELNDAGLIQTHRVYWGWRGVEVLQTDAYHRSEAS